VGFPEVGKIYKGKVKKMEAFGAFVEIPPFRSNGLVHKTQCSTMRIENVEDVLELGQEVFVKVMKVEMQEGQGSGPPRAKISLSIKWVSQTDGSDKDPEGIEQEAEERRRRPKDGAGATSAVPGGLSAASGMCSKCGQRGHLDTECFTRAGQNYELVPIGDEGVTTKLLPDDNKKRKEEKKQAKREKKRAKKEKKEKKKEKKEKKQKKEKKERRRESSSSRSSSQSGSDSGSGDERGPRPATPPAPSGPPFISYAVFSGKKVGYVFKNGPLGLGYYLDKLI
jgi:predicted RNA-binding protein with RPS1 domain